MKIGEKIKIEIKNSGKSVDEVAQFIGMSNQNLYRIFKKDSVETIYLQKICDFLKINIHSFFEEYNQFEKNNKKEIGSQKEEKKHNSLDIVTLLQNQIKELKSDKIFLQEQLAKP